VGHRQASDGLQSHEEWQRLAERRRGRELTAKAHPSSGTDAPRTVPPPHPWLQSARPRPLCVSPTACVHTDRPSRAYGTCRDLEEDREHTGATSAALFRAGCESSLLDSHRGALFIDTLEMPSAGSSSRGVPGAAPSLCAVASRCIGARTDEHEDGLDGPIHGCRALAKCVVRMPPRARPSLRSRDGLLVRRLPRHPVTLLGRMDSTHASSAVLLKGQGDCGCSWRGAQAPVGDALTKRPAVSIRIVD
jgi:hypothetical protein